MGLKTVALAVVSSVLAARSVDGGCTSESACPAALSADQSSLLQTRRGLHSGGDSGPLHAIPRLRRDRMMHILQEPGLEHLPLCHPVLTQLACRSLNGGSISKKFTVSSLRLLEEMALERPGTAEKNELPESCV